MICIYYLEQIFKTDWTVYLLKEQEFKAALFLVKSYYYLFTNTQNDLIRCSYMHNNILLFSFILNLQAFFLTLQSLLIFTCCRDIRLNRNNYIFIKVSLSLSSRHSRCEDSGRCSHRFVTYLSHFPRNSVVFTFSLYFTVSFVAVSVDKFFMISVLNPLLPVQSTNGLLSSPHA